MNKSLSTSQYWAVQMAQFASAKDLSSREIESRTASFVATSDKEQLGEAIKVLLTKLAGR